MGIFDFLKPKQQLEEEKILKQIQEKVFPQGKAQMDAEIKAVIKELNFKYSYEQVAHPYIAAATSYYLDEKRDVRKICRAICSDSGNQISELEAILIYTYLSTKDAHDEIEEEDSLEVAADKTIEMMRQMNKQNVPHRSELLTKELNALREMLNLKYTINQLETPYLVASKIFFLGKDNGAINMVKNIQRESNYLISNQEAFMIYMFIKSKGDHLNGTKQSQETGSISDDDVYSIATRLFFVSKGAIVELKTYRDLSDEGKFEVLLFNSVCVLNDLINKYPEEYEAVSRVYWAKVVEEAKLKNLHFETSVETFINDRSQFYINELDLLTRQQTEDNLNIPGKLFHTFYESPFCIVPVNSRNVPEVMTFTLGLTKMMNWVLDHTEEI